MARSVLVYWDVTDSAGRRGHWTTGEVFGEVEAPAGWEGAVMWRDPPGRGEDPLVRGPEIMPRGRQPRGNFYLYPEDTDTDEQRERERGLALQVRDAGGARV